MIEESPDQNIEDRSISEPTGGIRPRRIALSLLNKVLSRRQPLDQALDENEELSSLPSRDRAFVRMLVATTLRRLGQIDDFIRRATERDEVPNPPTLHHLLRIGAAQIAFMDVPDYAVVDTSVEIAELENLNRQKGLVNAVLRRIAGNHKEWLGKQDETHMNTPDWLMKIWINDYGLKETAEIAQANLSEAPLDISIKDLEMHEYWSGTLHASALPTGSLRRAAGGLVYNLPGFDDGMWWVQDASAAIPARLFGDIAGETVVDLCAAPGGKTAQLAAMGANVIALDRSSRRLKRLDENMARLRLDGSVITETADAAVWRPKEPVDYILLDAPCTATGTARRNPDVLHLKSQIDLDRLSEVQERLLFSAVEMLKPGGILIYCTCSLQKDEGEEQIKKLLSSGASVERAPVAAEEVGGLDMILTNKGDVRILPYHLATHGGMDGFFISRLRKL